MADNSKQTPHNKHEAWATCSKLQLGKVIVQTVHGYGHTPEAAVRDLNEMIQRYKMTRISKPRVR